MTPRLLRSSFMVHPSEIICCQHRHFLFTPSRRYTDNGDKKLVSATASTSRVRYDKTFGLVQDRNRWQRLVVNNGIKRPIRGVVVPLVPSQWDGLVSKLRSTAPERAADLGEWLDLQEGAVVLSPTDSHLDLLREYLEIGEPAQKIILLRVQDDEKATEGLRSRSTSLAPLVDLLGKSGDNDVYKLVFPKNSPIDVEEAVLSYTLECYSFDRYQPSNKPEVGKGAKLEFPSSAARNETLALTTATYLVRDLISVPAMDMTPESLQRSAESLVEEHDHADIKTIVGRDLLHFDGAVDEGHGCGMIYAVGAAATQPDHEPRLIQISHRPPEAKAHIALVGKGVTYDTGGLNLKPGSSMLNMKKDMGGAAHVLGLFSCLAELQAPLAIDVWIPVVENVVGPSSFRPGDILTCVSGETTEIGNTDAEGRLILGDALALASALNPDVIIDFATLTGAARVAMGTEVVPFFTNRPSMAKQLLDAAVSTRDPTWPLPLWHGYEKRITQSSEVAELRNIPNDNGLGGSITAALYLEQFVGKKSDGSRLPWIHLDVYGMDRATGIGEAQGLRAVYKFLCSQYCAGW